MLYVMATFNQIPPDSFAMRVKNTGIYIHINGGEVSIKEKMNGCFICSEDTAKDILTKLKMLNFEYDLELVKFSVAYKEHGLVERQIQYN